MFIKKHCFDMKSRGKKKITNLFGSIQNYCIFAPLFKTKFSNGKARGVGITKQNPVTYNPL